MDLREATLDLGVHNRTAYGWARQGVLPARSLPALMTAVCLREDRWLVHHLASDVPVGEVARRADEAGAPLVVLSSAMNDTAERAQQAARAIATASPHLTVLAGRPGDSLYDLLAQAAHPQATSASRRG